MSTILRTDDCAHCKFSTKESAGGLACRRYPPNMETFIVGHTGDEIAEGVPDPKGYVKHQIVTFPTTFAELWCGEFKPRIEGLS